MAKVGSEEPIASQGEAMDLVDCICRVQEPDELATILTDPR